MYGSVIDSVMPFQVHEKIFSPQESLVSRKRRVGDAFPRTIVALLTASFLATAVPACEGEVEVERPRARHATKSSKSDNNTEIVVTPQKVATGAELFARNCVKCHGNDAGGRVGIGPSLRSKTFLEAASNKMLLATIAEGRLGTTMTPWKSYIDAAGREALVAYIRSLTPHMVVELDESPLRGDPEAGKPIFESICVQCHGRSGAGYIESSSGTGIGRHAFLSTVTNGFLRYMIINGKSQTRMRGFDGVGAAVIANLDDQQIEDVIAYLRAHTW